MLFVSNSVPDLAKALLKFFPPTILATPTMNAHLTKPPFKMQRIKSKELKTFLNIVPSCLFYSHLVGH